MNKTNIPIKGMHCHSCEILIEDKLRELKDVKSVEVSYKKKTALIFSKHEIPQSILHQTIQEAGYEIGVDDTKDIISRDPNVWKDLAVVSIILLILYLIANKIGLFNISTGNSSNPSNLAVVLIVGLTAGFSTCMALVGGLILGISAKFSEKHPEASPVQKFRPHIFFNLGRIASYFVLGGLIGIIGKAFQLSGGTMGLLLMSVGVVMLIVGMQLTELFPRLSGVSLSLPSNINRFLGIKSKPKKEYSHANALISGALTFFLPCGFTQAMQLYAISTGSFWSGALIMATFAIGTTPGLLCIGGLTSIVRGSFARRFFKGAGLIVIALALFNISNGMNLVGLSGKLSNSFRTSPLQSNDQDVTLENGIQIIRMNQDSNGYSPNSFTIKNGIPARWIINSLDSQTCAASIYSQKLGIKKILSLGENVIEFTPNQSGRVSFSCSMGMYRGSFNIIDDTSLDTSNQTTDVAKTLDPSTAGSQTGTTSPITKVSPRQDSVSEVPATSPQRTDTKNDDSVSKESGIQIIKSTYTYQNDISPKTFNVKAGQPVQFEIDPKDDGAGCMSSIMVPDLSDDYQILAKDIPIIFNFTPMPGKYLITCAMGVPRGTIIAE